MTTGNRFYATSNSVFSGAKGLFRTENPDLFTLLLPAKIQSLRPQNPDRQILQCEVRLLRLAGEPRMGGHALRVDFGEAPRLRVLEDPLRKPLGSESHEAHQHRHDVLTLLRERPADQLGRVVFLDLPDHVGVFEFAQTKGEHPRGQTGNGAQETVESVGPLPSDVPDDEQAPLPAEDSQARRDRAVLEWNHGNGRIDGQAGHGQSPLLAERMGLRALKALGRTIDGNESRDAPNP